MTCGCVWVPTCDMRVFVIRTVKERTYALKSEEVNQKKTGFQKYNKFQIEKQRFAFFRQL